jgi:ribosomal protein S27AE
MMASLSRPKPVHSAETDRRGQRPNCPRCGSRLFLAEQSRFDVSGRIDHLWACDDCGVRFETSIALRYRAWRETWSGCRGKTANGASFGSTFGSSIYSNILCFLVNLGIQRSMVGNRSDRQ